jgi:hypothetical protein
MKPLVSRARELAPESAFEVSLGPEPSLEEAKKAYMSCLNLYEPHVCAIVIRDGEQVRLPRGLAGRFETAQMDHVH